MGPTLKFGGELKSFFMYGSSNFDWDDALYELLSGFLGFSWVSIASQTGEQAGHRQPWPEMIRASNRTHGEYLYRRGVAAWM